MKVCAVSPRKKASGAEILSFLESQTANLVVLPGAAANTPSPESVQRVLRRGVWAFVERRGGKLKGGRSKKGGIPCLVTRSKIREMPRQIFARKPTAKDMDALAAALERRTFSIAGRNVTFIICGEIIGFNVDGSGKRTRILDRGEIIANPAHSNMGRWHILDSRFQNLSKRGAAIHAANNVLKTTESKTDVRVYRRGRQIDNRQMCGNIAWCLADV